MNRVCTWTTLLLLFPFLLSPIAVSSAVPSNSSLLVGTETGFVQSNLETVIVLKALDSAFTPLQDASVTLQILVNGGADPSGTLRTDSGQETDASVASVYGTTNASGILVIFWKVPSVVTNLQADITATVHHGTDNYDLSVKTVTITPDVTSLDVYNVSVASNVYQGFSVPVTASAFKFLGGEYTNVQVSFSSDAGIFTPSSGTLDAGGRISVAWIAPDATGSVNISVVFTLADSVTTYSTSTLVNVSSVDLDNSSISLGKSSVKGGETVVVQINSYGSLGVIPAANITLSQNGGESSGTFESTVLTTNSSGIATTNWTAPMVTGEQSIEIVATVSFSGVTKLIKSQITVVPVLYDVFISSNSTEVDAGDAVEIIVHVEYNSVSITNAVVEVTASEGSLLQNNLKTDSNGNVSFVWKADLQPQVITGSNVLLLIQVYDNQSGVVESTKTIFVRPPVLFFPVNVSLDKNSLTVEEELTIEFVVMNYTQSEGYEGALISLSAVVGVFTSSNSSEVAGTTDSSGKVVFVWKPIGLSSPSQPQIVPVDVEISISTFNYLNSFSFNITVVPTTTSGTSGTSGSSSPSPQSEGVDLNTGIFIFLGATAIAAIAIVIVRRR